MKALARMIPELSRFFTVALAGLIIDIALASALIIWAGFADIPAAVLGLAAGMVFNYFMHLKWTFGGHARQASMGHFLQFSIGVGATLLVRIAVLHWLAVVGLDELLAAPVRLFIGAAASFVASYLINRWLVFGEKPKNVGGR